MLDHVFEEVLRQLVDYSPRILWAVVFLLVGWAIGRLGAWAIRRIFSGISLAEPFRKSSIGRALLRAGYTPVDFFASAFKFIVYILALFAAIDMLVPGLELLRTVAAYLPNIIAAIITLVLGILFSDWIAEIFEKGEELPSEYRAPLALAFRFFLYFVVITIMLSELKVDVNILYIFAQGFAWAIAIAVGVAAAIVLVREFPRLVGR